MPFPTVSISFASIVLGVKKTGFYGKSFCVSPEGELMDKPTGMKEAIAFIDIDLKEIERVRKEWSFFKDRRPEVYREVFGSEEIPCPE
jgi:N-carbamoylputrescine amidase